MVYYVIVTLYVIVCALLILTILLQQGKGGDIANAFGGGSTQAVFGARSGATLLTRATSVLAALFVIGAITLTVWGQRGPGSVVGGIDAPPLAPAPAAPVAAPAATPAPAPATPPATPPPGNTTP
jgi:preprotein translocase subunit SecG